MNNIPPFLEQMIDSCPKHGGGVHAWLFKVSRQLHAHLPAVEIIRLLEAKVIDCGRHVPHGEIVAAVQNALACAWRPGEQYTAKPEPKWPALNERERQRLLATDTNGRIDNGLVDLWEASKVPIDDNDSRCEEWIDLLFPGNPLLCCGKSKSEFWTKPREEWRGQLADLQQIVPSPMTAATGLTKEGKESAHSLSNTGPRRFLVVEFDQGPPDEHAALLLHLNTYAPLVLVVHSGGKSLHGWFYCADQPEDKVRRFFRYAVSLGADTALWTKSQFARMPDGTRDNGNRQAVFYFNPEPLQ